MGFTEVTHFFYSELGPHVWTNLIDNYTIMLGESSIIWRIGSIHFIFEFISSRFLSIIIFSQSILCLICINGYMATMLFAYVSTIASCYSYEPIIFPAFIFIFWDFLVTCFTLSSTSTLMKYSTSFLDFSIAMNLWLRA